MYLYHKYYLYVCVFSQSLLHELSVLPLCIHVPLISYCLWVYMYLFTAHHLFIHVPDVLSFAYTCTACVTSRYIFTTFYTSVSRLLILSEHEPLHLPHVSLYVSLCTRLLHIPALHLLFSSIWNRLMYEEYIEKWIIPINNGISMYSKRDDFLPCLLSHGRCCLSPFVNSGWGSRADPFERRNEGRDVEVNVWRTCDLVAS